MPGLTSGADERVGTTCCIGKTASLWDNGAVSCPNETRASHSSSRIAVSLTRDGTMSIVKTVRFTMLACLPISFRGLCGFT